MRNMFGVAAKRAAGTAMALGLVAGGVSACGSPEESPLGNTQWQVSHIYDEVAAGGLLPPVNQARTYMVFGEDHFTGQSGCVRLFGKLEWTGDYHGMRIKEFSTETPDEDAGSCQPADEDTATRLRAVLSDANLKLTRPESNTLKLMQATNAEGEDAEDEAQAATANPSDQWRGDHGVELISGPADTE